MGYLDGAHAAFRAGGFRTGLFGGGRPEVELFTLASSGLRAGFYLSLETPPAWRAGFFSATIGAVTETGRNTGDRDGAVVDSRLDAGQYLYATGQVEIDVNRGWRRQRAGNSYEVSSVLLAITGQPTPALSLALTLDQRRNVYTEEYLDGTTPFDDRENGNRVMLTVGYRL